ncbi:MAG: PBP1A family penicillin-binding protein [Treponema sp.]|nr:PBP1A family penicillin-binding protein [Treponema sp.]
MKRTKIWPFIFLPLLLCISALLGAALGKGLAVTKDTINTENFAEFEIDKATRILDVNGEIITEFTSDQKREFISFSELPQQIIDALLTREDKIFYDHPGFSMKALFRAVIGVLTHNSLGGGSTLSQQIAGTLYCDRRDMSITRKLKELWWAIQMERRYSKDEILELYLNRIYFGGGTTGVNAACKYYFGHDATDIDPAEAAILVIQLSNPAYYNPFDYPNRAMSRQQYVLDELVADGYITKEDADESFDNYWANFDYLRSNASVSQMTIDNAPWFSEYVRRELNGMLYGTDDIHTGGFTVNTTLNLAHQKVAEDVMADYIKYANDMHSKTLSQSKRSTFSSYIPLTELVALTFNIPQIKTGNNRSKTLAVKEFSDTLNPMIDIFSMMAGLENLKTGIVAEGHALRNKNKESSRVEGTMIALENKTGYIDAIVGGSTFDYSNQYIRAVQSYLQPGSSFKPLYYSAAIDAQVVTMTSPISDTPIVFYNANGSAYLPQNYVGSWKGEVEVWYALAASLNIPALKILDMVGFDAAIARSTDLLGIPQSEWEQRSIVPVYALGLGVCSVRPIELARAFAIFANNGEEVIPICIRNIEDRNGNIIHDIEQETINKKRAKGDDVQIISKQNAFIMQEMLKKTVSGGTLYSGARFESTEQKIGKHKGTGYKFTFKNENGHSFDMPVAGKTGTTQNWADAWAVGFTPYYTSVFWFGFDMPGESLGLQMTGSAISAPAWGDFMHEIHIGKPYKPFFDKMPSGVVRMKVCAESGMPASSKCPKVVEGYYLSGTQPEGVCELHLYQSAERTAWHRFERERIFGALKYDKLNSAEGLHYDLDFLTDGKEKEELMEDLFGGGSDSSSGSDVYTGPDNSWQSFFSDYFDGTEEPEEDSSENQQNAPQQETDSPRKTQETAEKENEGNSPAPNSGTEDEDSLSSFFE